MKLSSLSVDAFVRELASDSPAPGGGSASALSGSLAAGLVAMVCRLTDGKKGYEEYWPLAAQIRERADELAESLVRAIDEDTEAFEGVMRAFRMKKDTEEEKSARKEAIQSATKKACDSPMAIGERCLAVLELAGRIAGKGNANAASDLGVASELALAGVEGAAMNVDINLGSIRDETFVREQERMVRELLERGRASRDAIRKILGGGK